MTTPSTSPFHLRPAKPTPTDHAFILSAFDSSLPFLASIGSLDQWGKTPFSQRGDFAEATLKELNYSEEFRLTGTSGLDSNLRMFISERELHQQHDDGQLQAEFVRVTPDGRRFLPVGVAYVRENWVPTYVKTQTHLPMPDVNHGGGGFLYLEVMVTDNREDRRELSRGAGAALIRGIREYGEARGMRALWVDGWAGNERKLISCIWFTPRLASTVGKLAGHAMMTTDTIYLSFNASQLQETWPKLPGQLSTALPH
ncbi:hypothetical protein AKAW_08649 [Aspergillus niger]|uniref:N-acetyltransferase domain-containing protein n=1 Tax=Aspergillus niger TaxID=5061 RepID=A0A100IGG9_ASPNG|nr:hypothetical protein AKAW_08649 [Aspergillus niger]